ncbi:hypothetical protein BWL13_02454 [Microbacterium oleivorans]|uniref:hypothetical protein n=1 Tax=Microbacterium oleivorans TaxID=273677 RepID=UPI0009756629|nr:hypothetical protein [Microbacterium oleivorans]AZS44857.1 hypothetical protein BWL13_02454 [Microbacterium oleivorans]
MNRSLPSRLFLGGLPALMSAGVSAAVPLTGALFLSDSEYAIWALVSTLSTIFLLFDFGAPALATKLATEGNLSPQARRSVLLLTAAPPLALGMVACAIWPTYSASTGLGAYGVPLVLIAIGLVSVGCALRSASSVFAAAALGRQRYGSRAVILIAGATASALVTIVGLVGGAGLMALALGVAANGVVGVTLSLLLERHADPGATNVDTRRLVRLFMTSKGAATLLGLVITQLDRWALGLIGDSTLLATYDIASRIIQIPKIALLALLVGLVAEGASARGGELFRLWGRSTIVTAVVFAAAQLICLPLTFLIIQAGATPDHTVEIVFGMAVAQMSLTATIPTTLILSGQGRPHLELVYLAPTFVLILATYMIAISTSNGYFLVGGWIISVTITSLLYIVFGPRLIGATRA